MLAGENAGARAGPGSPGIVSLQRNIAIAERVGDYQEPSSRKNLISQSPSYTWGTTKIEGRSLGSLIITATRVGGRDHGGRGLGERRA